MPTSFVEQIELITQIIVRENPSSLLDIGAGYGKYGLLAREYADKYPWSMRIDAVEPFSYLDWIGNKVYDNVYRKDFLDIDFIDHYDLTLMIDVLEHFEKKDGWKALDKALALSKKGVLISTPVEPAVQGAEYGNPWEVHKSKWTVADIISRYNFESYPNGISVMGIILPNVFA